MPILTTDNLPGEMLAKTLQCVQSCALSSGFVQNQILQCTCQGLGAVRRHKYAATIFQYFWDSPNSRGHDWQPAGHRLHDYHAKRFLPYTGRAKDVRLS